MKKIVFASSNKGKIAEIRALLPEGFELLTAAEAGFEGDIEETGKTFEENAAIKARALFESSGLPVFADDSGLMVSALNGEPGVRSARYAGEAANDRANVELLLQKMKDKKDRKAKFVTVICLYNGRNTYFFEGEVKGRIIGEARGSNGFGYDPVFVPEGSEITFAEMEPAQKNKMSHRAAALRKLIPFLQHL